MICQSSTAILQQPSDNVNNVHLVLENVLPVCIYSRPFHYNNSSILAEENKFDLNFTNWDTESLSGLFICINLFMFIKW